METAGPYGPLHGATGPPRFPSLRSLCRRTGAQYMYLKMVWCVMAIILRSYVGVPLDAPFPPFSKPSFNRYPVAPSPNLPLNNL